MYVYAPQSFTYVNRRLISWAIGLCMYMRGPVHVTTIEPLAQSFYTFFFFSGGGRQQIGSGLAPKKFFLFFTVDKIYKL